MGKFEDTLCMYGIDDKGFNNIYKIEWTPNNICFVKTLSLSGNKIKQIPKDIIEL